jgi:hypothetical protein
MARCAFSFGAINARDLITMSEKLIGNVATQKA